MKIISPSFVHGGVIPSVYTCDGDNVNPPLQFLDVPDEAKSLVLLMDDPDVPLHIRPDGVWDHWVVVNMPAGVDGIQENSAPLGVVGCNTRGINEYGGPCPPDGEHRYFFKLYALDCMLGVHECVTKAEVLSTMRGHILAEAELMGTYKRTII